MTVKKKKYYKLDPITAEAIDLAREAAEKAAKDFGVGEHLRCFAEGDRVVTHRFVCLHPGYVGWQWSVTLVRASRAKVPTVSEVNLLPAEDALLAKAWVPWEDRVQPGDIAPGTVLPTPDEDPRLDPGYATADIPADADPQEWAQTRALISELGLGRERVLSGYGRDQTVMRWMAGESGPKNAYASQAPGFCHTCGFFVPLRGGLGELFGACTNEYSPFDARVVNLKHGCGGHSDVPSQEKGIDLPPPYFDTIGVDDTHFD